MEKKVRIQPVAYHTIATDIQQRRTIEACGVLLGTSTATGWEVIGARPLPNVYASPTYFEFDPADLLQIHLEEEERIIGVYHSHPYGPPYASGTDRRQIASMPMSDWIWLIFSGSSVDGPDAWPWIAAYHYDCEKGPTEVPVALG